MAGACRKENKINFSVFVLLSSIAYHSFGTGRNFNNKTVYIVIEELMKRLTAEISSLNFRIAWNCLYRHATCASNKIKD